MNGLLFPPQSNWVATPVSQLPSWRGAKRIAIDIECRDEHIFKLGPGVRRGGEIVGIGFAIQNGPAHYVPIGHRGGGNVDAATALRYFKDEARDYCGIIDGQNLGGYDLDYLATVGVTFPKVHRFRDVGIADTLLNQLQTSYALDAIGKRHVGRGKNEKILREYAAAQHADAKSDLWKFPASMVGAYCEEDCRLPTECLEKIEPELEKIGSSYIYDIESRLIPIVLKVTQRGILIDQDRLAQIDAWCRSEEQRQLDEIHRLTGFRLAFGGVWQAAAIGPILESIGLRPAKKPGKRKDKYIIDKQFLSNHEHPVTTALIEARKVNKIRTTYVAQTTDHLVNGRIHPVFNQTAREKDSNQGGVKGVRGGRMSADHPSVQNQPTRAELVIPWRSIYLPEPGAQWGEVDISQQEPRLTTHFAAKLNLPGAREKAQAYIDDPALDDHTFMAELTELPRKIAKNVGLGIAYNMGGAKLCNHYLKLPTRFAIFAEGEKPKYFDRREEAWSAMIELENEKAVVIEVAGKEGQEILDIYNDRAPFIKLLAKKATERAQRVGQIVTLLGRVIRFPRKPNGQFDWTHKALNVLIQNSAADQSKKGWVDIGEQCPDAFVQAYVHDSTGGSVSSPTELIRWAELMRDAVTIGVPVRVDASMGPSWGDKEDLKAA